MIQLQHYAVLRHVLGTQEKEIQYYVLLYTCARTLVHVPGTCDIIHNLQRQTAATVVVVLHLLASNLSAAACLTLYTAV